MEYHPLWFISSLPIFELMIKLSKEAGNRHQAMLDLEQQQQLLESQLHYTINNNSNLNQHHLH